MIFSSAPFLVFFEAVVGVYFLAKTGEQRASVLLAASILFYGSWKPAYLILLAISVTANWLVYRQMLARRSRSLLVIVIAANLLVLGCFKYLALIIESSLWIMREFGGDVVVSRPSWIDWVLPLGISFYTFHMLSAMIDVYRGECTKKIHFRHWCLFVTFFPQLIAGPIVRVHELVSQLESLEPVRWVNFKLGAFIFAGGLIKKALFADNLAPIVDELYSQPERLDLLGAWLATLAFGMEIYLDFSGYSEMALGLAKMFGIELPLNFRFPYLSRSPTEFWRRWHMTLSRWLRDYLYISLGGNRLGCFYTYRNLFLTMLLGGLWHGANWTFVFWGFLQGVYLMGDRLVSGVSQRFRLCEFEVWRLLAPLLGWIITFSLIHISWVFFRAPSFADAWRVCEALSGFSIAANPVPLRTYEILGVFLTGLLVLLEPVVVDKFRQFGIQWWWRVPFLLRGVAYATLVLAVVVFGGPTQKFIYFDF